MNTFTNEIALKISNEYPDIEYNLLLTSLEKPKNKQHGDITLPCFKLSKLFRMSPDKIAEKMLSIFQESIYFSEVTNINGFLNFKYSRSLFLRETLEEIHEDRIFQKLSANGKNKTMVIDFSSPNIAKKLHLGTFRSTVIGNAIQKIYKEMGWKTIRINHLGDWGTQFGKLMTAFKMWGNHEELKKSPMEYLQQIYVKFNQEVETQPQLLEDARQWFSRLEEKESEAYDMWQQFREYTLEDLHKSYKRVGVSFDFFWGEAFYEPFLKDMMQEIEESNISEISEGALIVDLKEYNMPPCLIRKSNGTSIYATRDIAAAKYRYQKFNFEKMLYVVGSPQKLHFQQIFSCLKLLGYNWSELCEFIGFGQIQGLSTRKGTAVYLDEIFDEAQERILKIINLKNKDIANKEELADKIGIGAIIFQDLSKTRIKDSTFDWDRILAFDGETGPYVQYTFVRIHNILEKIKIPESNILEKINFDILSDDNSYEITSLLALYTEKIKIAFRETEPYIIANYLIDLAKSFNRFYRNNRVVNEKEDIVLARGFLLLEVSKIYKRCMEILGIPILYQM